MLVKMNIGIIMSQNESNSISLNKFLMIIGVPTLFLPDLPFITEILYLIWFSACFISHFHPKTPNN